MSKTILGFVVLLGLFSLLGNQLFAEKAPQSHNFAKELARFLKIAGPARIQTELKASNLEKLLTLRGIKVSRGSSAVSAKSHENKAQKMISSMSDKERESVSRILGAFTRSYNEVSQLPVPPADKVHSPRKG